MAKFSKADSRRMYSWWWDSHISPKNSKWLQENLTDMDAKVKMMIKLIEEDADSFARRAEMYYKKRPELMKLVEEFYRAYRALSERYDHATGVIRHAHRTMADAFPNQVPLLFADESPDPSTPIEDMSDDSDSVPRRKVSKQFKNTFVARSLHFNDAEDKEENTHTNGDNHNEDLKPLNSMLDGSSEEILALKAAIAKLEAEKEAGLSQYQQCLDKLSRIETEVSKTKEDFRILSDHAKKAENEVIILNEKLSALEADRESKLQDYKQCVEKMSKLQEDAEEVNGRANSSDIEVQSLKSDLEKLANEKDVALNQYMQSLGTISFLENKLLLAEEDAEILKTRAGKAETQVEVLRETVSKLTEDKEASTRKYQQCLETLSAMEEKLKNAQEEAKRLKAEVDTGVEKLKGAEEQCSLLERSNQSLHSELEALASKLGPQTHELTEKQKELGMLWTCIQEERLRFVEVETAFQTLQHLHAKTQEELRGMASELQNRAQLLMAMETEKQSLQDEVSKVKEENKNLDAVNVSSALSMKDMKNEILSLVKSKEKLQEEVELRIDERNALQQEIYCLKEELNDVNAKHLGILDQVTAVGLDADSLGSSVKEIKDEQARLKATCEMERSEKLALLGKLEILDQLLEKNTLLETSLSDLNAELEATREKIKELEWSMQSLLKENSTLLDDKETLVKQLEEANNNLEKLSQTNTVLENSLSDAHNQLEALMTKSRILEDSQQLLVHEKAGLKSENDGLVSELGAANVKLEDLGNLYEEFKGRCVALEKEKESTLRKAQELELSLEVERQQHAKYVQTCQTKFKTAETEMSLLQEQCKSRERELDQVMDMAIDNDLGNFIFSITAQELKEMNYSLIAKNVKLLDESSLLEKKIVWLEENSLKQQTEIKSLSDQVGGLRVGTRRLLEEVLDPVEVRASEDEAENDQADINQLLMKLQNLKESCFKSEDEKLEASVQVSVLLPWIRQVMEMNEELKRGLREEEYNKKELMMQTEDLNTKLMDIQGSCQVLQIQKSELYQEKSALMDHILKMEEKIHVVEEENYVLNDKVLDLENLSLIFRSFANEKVSVIRELCAVLNKLQDVNVAVIGKSSLTEGKLEESRMENIHLSRKLQKTEEELKDVVTLRNHLNDEIERGKVLMQQMALELKQAEDKIRLVEKEKYESNKIVEDLRVLYDEAKMDRDVKADQFLKLSTDTDQLRSEKAVLHEANHRLEIELQKKLIEISELESGAASLFGQLQYFMVSQLLHEHKLNELHETCGGYMDRIVELSAGNDQLSSENASLVEARHKLEVELQKRVMDTNELESGAASLFGQLQHSMISQLLYEHKFNELRETCLGYTDQNEGLRIQLAAFAPEIESLKECIFSLEDHAKKFQHPLNEELQVSDVANGFHESTENEDEKELVPDALSALRDIRARLQVIAKSEIMVKELMIQENTDLHSKLDASMNQLELLQNDNGKNRRNRRPVSEITEDESILLTKDILLDQISHGSSHFSKREPVVADNQMVELWEPSGPESSKTEFLPDKSVTEHDSRLQIPDSSTEKDLTVGTFLASSKRSVDPIQEANKRKILERLDSDVQKLVNFQITVQDMKRKLAVTEKGRQGKAVIECEALKGQLAAADTAILKLFDVNGSLMKNINDGSFSDMKSFSSFDLEGEDGDARRRKISQQAQRMSEKIGRLQLEVEKLQFVLIKLDDVKEATKRVSTRKRVLLRDYLYGRGRTGQMRKKVEFCSCVQPSTKD